MPQTLRNTTRQTMAAAVITRPGELRVDDAPVPEPGPTEVRVKLEGCGVCASNIPPWEGREWFTYPMAPGQLGHEGWGHVDAVGTAVTDLSEGDRVAMLSDHAYAQYDIAPADAIVPLPAALEGRPFPGEPLGCAMNIFERSEIRSGDTVAIVGVGFLGACLTRLADQSGARVIAISRRPSALNTAREMGAAETIKSEEKWRTIEAVKEMTGGELCDRVIEATGKQDPLDLAGELTKERGRLVVAGFHQDGLRQVNMQLWNWRGIDVINAHERDPRRYTDGIRTAIDRIAGGTLDPTPLFTHTFPLDQLGDGLEAARQRPEGFIKALVRMDGA